MDGGWWITPLTGRATLLPVVLYAAGPRDYILSVSGMAGRASSARGCSAEFWDIIREQALTFVYLTEGKGSVQPEDLDGCPGLEKVYQHDGIDIYKVIN
jgi:hypothetical protein